MEVEAKVVVSFRPLADYIRFLRHARGLHWSGTEPLELFYREAKFV